MNLREIAEAMEQALDWLKWERESLEEFHAYAHMFGGQPGSNVFTFVLEDALRHRGRTLAQFRTEVAARRQKGR